MSYSRFFWLKLPTLGILISAAAKAAEVAKLVILGISPLTSFILALIAVVEVKLVVMLGISPLISFILGLREALVAKLVMSDILSSIFFYLSITLLFKLLKLVEAFFSLSISNLSTLDFKLAKSTFLVKLWSTNTCYIF